MRVHAPRTFGCSRKIAPLIPEKSAVRRPAIQPGPRGRGAIQGNPPGVPKFDEIATYLGGGSGVSQPSNLRPRSRPIHQGRIAEVHVRDEFDHSGGRLTKWYVLDPDFPGGCKSLVGYNLSIFIPSD